MPKSKPLSHPDNSGFDFTKEILAGDSVSGINFDFLIFDPEAEKFNIFELLLCEESQSVSPYSSHPNRYFHKNSKKFIGLWKAAKAMNADLFLVNYAKSGTKHQDEVLVMKVLDVKPSDFLCPVVTKNIKMTRLEFSERFRAFNARCKR